MSALRKLLIIFFPLIITQGESLSLFKRVVPEEHQSLEDKVTVEGFPKPAKSVIGCAAQTTALIKSRDFSKSKYDYVNAFNFEDGLCEPVKLRLADTGTAFDGAEVVSEEGWFLHQGCNAVGRWTPFIVATITEGPYIGR